MATKGLIAGGTPGAKPSSGSSAERFSLQFRFDPDTRARFLPLLPPCEAWLDQFRAGLVEIVDSEEAAITMVIEGCAGRFLRNRLKPAGVTDQRDYLKALDQHVTALIELLTGFPSIDGTTADFFKFMERASRDHNSSVSGSEIKMNTYNVLATLQVFARYRLTHNLAPAPYEAKEQKAKRKSTYARFVLTADLLAAFQRITGTEPMATANNSAGRKVSPAVEFLSIVLPPILRAARTSAAETLEILDDQTIRKSIADVKNYWKEGLRPEIAYAFTNWGDRQMPTW